MGGFSISVRERGSTKRQRKGKRESKGRTGSRRGFTANDQKQLYEMVFFFDIHTLALPFFFFVLSTDDDLVLCSGHGSKRLGPEARGG